MGMGRWYLPRRRERTQTDEVNRGVGRWNRVGRRTPAGLGVPGRTTADSHAVLNIDRYGERHALGRRLVLVAVLAAAIVGGMLPHAALSAVPGRTAEIVQAAEAPLAGPLHCLDATCGKGAPSAPTPTPGVVLAAVIGGVVAAFALQRLRDDAAASASPHSLPA